MVIFARHEIMDVALIQDAKNDSCQKVWSEIDAKERAKREEEEAERMAKEREARMKEQLEKDKEIKERLAKEKEREREARIKAAPVRMSAVAARWGYWVGPRGGWLVMPVTVRRGNLGRLGEDRTRGPGERDYCDVLGSNRWLSESLPRMSSSISSRCHREVQC